MRLYSGVRRNIGAGARILSASICALAVVASASVVAASADSADEFAPSPSSLTDAIHQSVDNPNQAGTWGKGVNSPSPALASLINNFQEPLALLDSDPGRAISEMDIEKAFDGGLLAENPEGEKILVDGGYTVDHNGQPVPIDLTLNERGESFVAAQPIVSAEIPKDPSDPLVVGNLNLQINGAADNASRVVGDQDVFYPSTHEATDTLIAPTTQGVEILHQLRNEDAPTTFRYSLGESSGIETNVVSPSEISLKQNGETVGRIAVPWAFDSSGNPIRAELTLEGSQVVLNIDPDEDATYPLLVDPQVDVWGTSNSTSGSWFNGENLTGLNYWQWTSNDANVTTGANYQCKSGESCWGTKGLYTYFKKGVSYAANQQGQWGYRAPGTTAYITDAWLGPLFMNMRGTSTNCTQSSPLQFAGLWNATTGTWAPNTSTTAGLGFWSANNWAVPQYRQFSQGTSTGNQWLYTGMTSFFGATQPADCGRDAYVGGAVISLTDPEAPSLSVTSSPSDWMGSTASRIDVTASDPGLGVFGILAETTDWHSEAKSWLTFTPTSNGMSSCTGVSTNPCPATYSSSSQPSGITYDTSTLPDGINHLKVSAVDPLLQVSTSTNVQIKVDHTRPALALSGALRERLDRSVGTQIHPLTVEASDGSDDEPGSGVVSLTVKLDGSTVASSTPGSCSGDSCQTSVSWSLDPTTLTSGSHSISIVAVDEVGNTKTQNSTVTVDPGNPCADIAVTVPTGCNTDTTDLVYLVSTYHGNPYAGGTIYSIDIVHPASNRAFVSATDGVRSRGIVSCPNLFCAEERSEYYGENGAPSDYFQTTGTQWPDPDIDAVSDVLRPFLEYNGAPTVVGNIQNAILGFQKLPKGHGTQYGKYVTTEWEESTQIVTTWWVDVATRLPLRLKVTTSEAGGDSTSSELRYFNYFDWAPATDYDPNTYLIDVPSTTNEESVDTVDHDLAEDVELGDIITD